jgi:hypothetical protein
MPDGDGNDPPPGGTEKRKTPRSCDSEVSEDFYKPYLKNNYRRLFPETAVSAEYCIYVESYKDNEKLGNNNPIVTTNLFKNDVKGILNIKRINASKICITFSQTNNANNFLKNEEFLTKHKFKAYIPAAAVESIGVLRFVPTSISNEELFKKLSTPYEIVAVRRFTKKDNGAIKAFQTVSITFLSNVLPEFVYLDLFRFRVHEYNAPLLQCFKCFKFNHGAKICKSVQKCSVCSGEHHFSECPDNNIIKCINCQGPHLAISRDCPIKIQKNEEKKNKLTYSKIVAKEKTNNNNNLTMNYEKNFPKLHNSRNKFSIPQKKVQNPTMAPSVSTDSNIVDKNLNISNEKLVDEIINNEFILKSLIGALVAIGNEGRAITSNVVQELLIKSLKPDQ